MRQISVSGLFAHCVSGFRFCIIIASPQQGDLRLSGPLSDPGGRWRGLNPRQKGPCRSPEGLASDCATDAPASVSVLYIYLAVYLKSVFVSHRGLQKPRQFFVLINPNSGRKTASRVFYKKVAPLFRACGVSFRAYETSGPTDARNAFRDLDFSTLDG
ncbi:sphingosine kinase 1 [Plakobranchus ocellatus]|uniref:Sphingosine kinase 1 n=1 Tax=Plakobranchus ocellatus TaxID=259542 RepID=A0AAV4BCC1_9GAST|nr:sphingosine kinase 1 [Plakobranchus ocellatus]